MKIQGGRHPLRSMGVPKVGGDRRLVRALVLREPDVPVDSRHRAAHGAGIDHEVGRYTAEPEPKIGDHAEKGIPDGGLVPCLVSGEPLAVVVRLDFPKEAEEVRRKRGGFDHWAHFTPVERRFLRLSGSSCIMTSAKSSVNVPSLPWAANWSDHFSRFAHRRCRSERNLARGESQRMRTAR